MNVVWVDYKRLFVKEACFDLKDEKRKPMLPRLHGARVQGSGQRVKQSNINVKGGGNTNDPGGLSWNKTNPRRFFAQTLMGETLNPSATKAPEIIIKSDGVGNGWLLRSAITVLRRVILLNSLKVSFSKEHSESIQVRALRGLDFESHFPRHRLLPPSPTILKPYHLPPKTPP